MTSNNYEQQNEYPPMGQNPSMYRPRNLSPEEEALLKRLRLESSWKAGYPFALIAGGTLALLTRNLTTPVRIGCTVSGMIGGNIVGKLSYIPTIRQRIIEDLPESSELRKKVLAMSDGTAFSTLGNLDGQQNSEDHIEFSTGEEYDMRNLEPEAEENARPKKYTTYEEIRKRNREKQQNRDNLSAVPRMETASETSYDDVKEVNTGMESNSGGKVRYNKYGDRIME